ncbi:hypothetical protein BTO28_12090 [Domibacillus epiphyticus]|uniref:CheW-like domain-containing protein n=2 Tax=Domibacillus epiphyticus TaxID=1714355 RepID=A0A1V2A678_9BACI|nr:hypothetical protein BTO28_12090 [Domibacillus epiphyticus]
MTAFMVERTNEIINVDKSLVKPVDSILTSTVSFIKGISLQEDRLISIIDIEKLLLSIKDIDFIRNQMDQLLSV